MPRRWALGSVLAALCLAGALWIPGCGSAPYTERSQLLLLSEAEEADLGVEAYQQEVNKYPLSSRSDWAAMVRRAGEAVSAQAIADGYGRDFQWEYRLLASETVNAFCLPGGKVAFYEGIMPVCQNEAGVAVVMGHEIGHAIARHGGERVSQGIVAELGMGVVEQFLSGGGASTTNSLISQALGIGVGVGMLGFSRSQESEADHIGLLLMAKAGYDPREAPRFWERMQAMSGGGSPPEFLSTHPSHATRIAQLEAWMPEALGHYRPR